MHGIRHAHDRPTPPGSIRNLVPQSDLIDSPFSGRKVFTPRCDREFQTDIYRTDLLQVKRTQSGLINLSKIYIGKIRSSCDKEIHVA